MNDVNAHVTWPCDADEGIHIGTIHVYQAAGGMYGIADLTNVGLKDAYSIRICQHKARDSALVTELSKVSHVGQALGCRTNSFYPKAGDRRRCRICPMRRIRYQHHPSVA